MRTRQQGSSLIIILIMLTVLAVASLSLARVNETSTLVAGNMAFKAAAMQASEVGLSEAFAALQTLTVTELDADKSSSAYYATSKTLDAAGLPAGTAWSAPVDVPNGFKVSYVIERMCTTAPVTDVGTQCFVKRLPAGGSARAGAEQMDAPAVVQFRMTVNVQGPKGTQTFVQAMATRST